MTVYVVPATVVRVVDGDTIHCNLDLGWGVFKIDSSVRLDLINAPEMITPEGKEARKFLMDALGPLPVQATVTSRSIDKYGRVLASVYVDKLGDLSQLMIAAGHAQAWGGRGPKP